MRDVQAAIAAQVFVVVDDLHAPAAQLIGDGGREISDLAQLFQIVEEVRVGAVELAGTRAEPFEHVVGQGRGCVVTCDGVGHAGDDAPSLSHPALIRSHARGRP